MKELKEITMTGLHDIIEKIVSKNKYKQHLDIGCGTGALLERLKKCTNKRCGCDINNNNFIKNKEIIFKKANLNKEFPFRQKFDLITCIEVIEHVENQFKLLKDISEHLEKNGVCILSTPNNYTIFNKLYFLLTNNLIHFNNKNMLSTGHINPVFENILLHYAEKNKLTLIKKQYSKGHIPILNVSFPIKTRAFGNVVIYVFKK